tara:strand:- start:3329 stop:3931 length:603 start_codon:yes stop_codon:yes gene_type:complete
MKKLIAQGAEAKLYQDNKEIIKHRLKKSYRIPEIDLPIRKFRTKREAKVLSKLQAIDFPSPKLISSDSKETIVIEKIPGKLVKDQLNNKNSTKLSKEIGKLIATLHNQDIIHGDLTTSNMIYSKDKIFLIDFGLSFFSHKIEDKAVDLHLLQEGLEAKHSTIFEKCFKYILTEYQKSANSAADTIQRLKQVEKRGRYKNK